MKNIVYILALLLLSLIFTAIYRETYTIYEKLYLQVPLKHSEKTKIIREQFTQFEIKKESKNITTSSLMSDTSKIDKNSAPKANPVSKIKKESVVVTSSAHKLPPAQKTNIPKSKERAKEKLQDIKSEDRLESILHALENREVALKDRDRNRAEIDAVIKQILLNRLDSINERKKTQQQIIETR